VRARCQPLRRDPDRYEVPTTSAGEASQPSGSGGHRARSGRGANHFGRGSGSPTLLRRPPRTLGRYNDPRDGCVRPPNRLARPNDRLRTPNNGIQARFDEDGDAINRLPCPLDVPARPANVERTSINGLAVGRASRPPSIGVARDWENIATGIRSIVSASRPIVRVIAHIACAGESIDRVGIVIDRCRNPIDRSRDRIAFAFPSRSNRP
jgi:hypothetical protein